MLLGQTKDLAQSFVPILGDHDVCQEGLSHQVLIRTPVSFLIKLSSLVDVGSVDLRMQDFLDLHHLMERHKSWLIRVRLHQLDW